MNTYQITYKFNQTGYIRTFPNMTEAGLWAIKWEEYYGPVTAILNITKGK